VKSVNKTTVKHATTTMKHTKDGRLIKKVLPVSPALLTQSFGWKRRDVFVQHDVHALSRCLYTL